MKAEERVHLNPGALTAPLPPAMVTVGDMESANVLTVAWTGILATVPPKTYISVRPSRHSYGILKERGEFVINLPCEELALKVDFVGIYTGAKMDKFERCGLTKLKSKLVAAPTIAECPLALECKVTEVLTMGSHDVFIADIVSVSCRGELMGEDGKLMLDRARLLAYAHGEYFALGEKLGRFGFSTDKNKGTRPGGGRRSSRGAREKSEGGEVAPKKTQDINFPTKPEGDRGENGKPTTDKDAEKIKEPFYKGMPKGRQRARSDKGKPHGKRVKQVKK